MNDLLAVGLLVVSWLCLFVAWCGSRRWLTFLGVGLAASCSPIPQQDPVVKNHHKPVNVSDINNGSDSSDPRCFAAGEVAYFAAHSPIAGTDTWSLHWWKPTEPCKTNPLGPLPGEPNAVTVHQNSHPVAAVGTQLLRWDGANFATIAAGNLTHIHALASTAPNTTQRAFALVTIDGEMVLRVQEVQAANATNVLATKVPGTDGGSLHAIGIGAGANDPVEIAFVAEATGAQLFLGNHPNRALAAAPIQSPIILTAFQSGFVVTHEDGAGRAISRFDAGVGKQLQFFAVDGKQITSPADAIYGAAAWKCGLWVLARHAGKIGLYELAGEDLKWRGEFKGATAADGARSLVPLGTQLGLLTGPNTFWNLKDDATGGKAVSDEIKSDDEISALWPFEGEALFAADCTGSGQCAASKRKAGPLGVELARWWSD